MESLPKRLRSQALNIVVSLVQGNAKTNFECYQVALSFSSPCVCVCVWSAVGNISVPVGPAVRLVHPIKAPLPPQRATWRGFSKARCPAIAGSDYPWQELASLTYLRIFAYFDTAFFGASVP